MKPLLSAVALCVVCNLCAAQTLVVQARGAKPGTYYLQITVGAGGEIHTEQIRSVVSLVGNGSGPDGPGPVPPGPGPLGLIEVASQAVALVTGDDQRAATALKWCLAYRELAAQIGVSLKRQDGPKPWNQVSGVTKEVRDKLAGPAATAWEPWVKAVNARLTELEKTGKLNTEDDVRAAWLEIASGLESQAIGAQAGAQQISDEFRELLMQIIKLIIEMILQNLG